MGRRRNDDLDYMPTRGVRTDLKRFMNSFLAKNTVRYEIFSHVWRERNMSYLCAGRSTDREAREFLERVLLIVQEYFLPPYQFQVRVGGLYLLYAMYQIQPIIPKVKIRMTPGQWQETLFFQQQAATQNHLDVVYIFHRLLQEQAFLFCYTSTEMSIHSYVKESEDREENLADSLKEEKTAVANLFNYESLEKLSYLQDQYQQMKIGLAGPQATKPDKSLDVVQAELVEDIVVFLQSFKEKVSALSRFGQRTDIAKKPGEEEVDNTGTRRQQLKVQAYSQLGARTNKRQKLHATNTAASPTKASKGHLATTSGSPTKASKVDSSDVFGFKMPSLNRQTISLVDSSGGSSSDDSQDEDYLPTRGKKAQRMSTKKDRKSLHKHKKVADVSCSFFSSTGQKGDPEHNMPFLVSDRGDYLSHRPQPQKSLKSGQTGPHGVEAWVGATGTGGQLGADGDQHKRRRGGWPSSCSNLDGVTSITEIVVAPKVPVDQQSQVRGCGQLKGRVPGPLESSAQTTRNGYDNKTQEVAIQTGKPRGRPASQEANTVIQSIKEILVNASKPQVDTNTDSVAASSGKCSQNTEWEARAASHVAGPVKARGRPRKSQATTDGTTKAGRGRGRPKKNSLPLQARHNAETNEPRKDSLSLRDGHNSETVNQRKDSLSLHDEPNLETVSPKEDSLSLHYGHNSETAKPRGRPRKLADPQILESVAKEIVELVAARDRCSRSYEAQSASSKHTSWARHKDSSCKEHSAASSDVPISFRPDDLLFQYFRNENAERMIPLHEKLKNNNFYECMSQASHRIKEREPLSLENQIQIVDFPQRYSHTEASGSKFELVYFPVGVKPRLTDSAVWSGGQIQQCHLTEVSQPRRRGRPKLSDAGKPKKSRKRDPKLLSTPRKRGRPRKRLDVEECAVRADKDVKEQVSGVEKDARPETGPNKQQKISVKNAECQTINGGSLKQLWPYRDGQPINRAGNNVTIKDLKQVPEQICKARQYVDSQEKNSVKIEAEGLEPRKSVNFPDQQAKHVKESQNYTSKGKVSSQDMISSRIDRGEHERQISITSEKKKKINKRVSFMQDVCANGTRMEEMIPPPMKVARQTVSIREVDHFMTEETEQIVALARRGPKGTVNIKEEMCENMNSGSNQRKTKQSLRGKLKVTRPLASQARGAAHHVPIKEEHLEESENSLSYLKHVHKHQQLVEIKEESGREHSEAGLWSWQQKGRGVVAGHNVLKDSHLPLQKKGRKQANAVVLEDDQLPQPKKVRKQAKDVVSEDSYLPLQKKGRKQANAVVLEDGQLPQPKKVRKQAKYVVSEDSQLQKQKKGRKQANDFVLEDRQLPQQKKDRKDGQLPQQKKGRKQANAVVLEGSQLPLQKHSKKLANAVVVEDSQLPKQKKGRKQANDFVLEDGQLPLQKQSKKQANAVVLEDSQLPQQKKGRKHANAVVLEDGELQQKKGRKQANAVVLEDSQLPQQKKSRKQANAVLEDGQLPQQKKCRKQANAVVLEDSQLPQKKNGRKQANTIVLGDSQLPLQKKGRKQVNDVVSEDGQSPQQNKGRKQTIAVVLGDSQLPLQKKGRKQANAILEDGQLQQQKTGRKQANCIVSEDQLIEQKKGRKQANAIILGDSQMPLQKKGRKQSIDDVSEEAQLPQQKKGRKQANSAVLEKSQKKYRKERNTTFLGAGQLSQGKRARESTVTVLLTECGSQSPQERSQLSKSANASDQAQDKRGVRLKSEPARGRRKLRIKQESAVDAVDTSKRQTRSNSMPVEVKLEAAWQDLVADQIAPRKRGRSRVRHVIDLTGEADIEYRPTDPVVKQERVGVSKLSDIKQEFSMAAAVKSQPKQVDYTRVTSEIKVENSGQSQGVKQRKVQTFVRGELEEEVIDLTEDNRPLPDEPHLPLRKRARARKSLDIKEELPLDTGGHPQTLKAKRKKPRKCVEFIDLTLDDSSN